MEKTPLLNAQSNNGKAQNEISTSSYGTTNQCPPEHFNEFSPPYSCRDAVQALGWGHYPFASTTLKPAYAKVQAIDTEDRKRRQHDRRQPRRRYDIDAAEERNMEPEPQAWKRLSLSLIGFYVVVFGLT